MGEITTGWTREQRVAYERIAEFASSLRAHIPQTSNGQPTGYLDTQRLIEYYSTHLSNTGNESGMILYETDFDEVCARSDCFIPLTWQDGLGLTSLGTPFWERIEGESVEYYELFKAYREATHIKYLETAHSDAKDPNVRYPLQHERSRRSARSVHTIADRADIERGVAVTISRLWFWHERARAHDIYQAEQLELLRHAQIQYMENVHSVAARKIFNISLDFLDKNKQDLNPKTALEWFQMAIELERLSLGLPKDKPAIEAEAESQRTDRRSWVQVNVNNQENHIEQKREAGDANARLREILSTLDGADALKDITDEKAETDSESTDATASEQVK